MDLTSFRQSRMNEFFFSSSYNILAPNAASASSDPKEASMKVVATIELDQDEYRFGQTKVSNLREMNVNFRAQSCRRTG